MNERIKELYYKAHDTSDVEGSFPQYFSATKFAELIVQACIEELETSKRCDPYTGELFTCEYNDCLNDQIAMLKEEFGIKRYKKTIYDEISWRSDEDRE